MKAKKVFLFLAALILVVLFPFLIYRQVVFADIVSDTVGGVVGELIDIDMKKEIEKGRSYSADQQSFPNVSLQTISPMGIQSGEELNMRATNYGFNMTEPIHNSWCIDGVPYASVLAGSSDQVKGKEGNYYLENRFGALEGGAGVCGLYKDVNEQWYKKITNALLSQDRNAKAPDNFYLKRIPNVDEDNDGMDDEWEIKSFGGRRVPETNQFFPGRDDRGALLAAIKSGDDPDKDGWKWNYLASGGLPLIQHSPFKAPWLMGVPYAAGSITGDDKFTNYEEYVFGTDPLIFDTDQDGIMDEGDVAGLNQGTLNLRITKKPGSSYFVVIYGFGINSRWDADKNNSGRQWEKYWRADFPNKQSLKGVKINEDKEAKLFVSEGMIQQISIDYTPKPVYFGEEVTIKTEVISLSSAQKSNLIYNWYRDGDSGEEEKKQSGLGKNVYKFKPGDSNKCEEVIELEVINNDTQKLDYREIAIPIGLNFNFKKEILGNATDVESIANFNSKNNSNTADYLSLINSDDPYLAEINDDGVGFRKGDLVNFLVDGLKNNYNPACYGGKIFDEFEKDLVYSWRMNGVPQLAKNGLGEDYSNIKYILTKNPRVAVKNNIDDSGSLFLEGQEAINVEIKDSEDRLISAKTEKLKISPPYAKFDVENANKVSSITGQKAGSQTFIAKEGKTIKINAHLYNFRPTAEGFTFIWSRNGQESVKEERIFSNQGSYEFKLDYSASGAKMDLEKEDISLKVVNKISGLKEIEEAQSNVVVGVEGKFKMEGAGAGAIIQALPGYVKSMFVILFIPALIAFFVILKMKKEREDNIV